MKRAVAASVQRIARLRLVKTSPRYETRSAARRGAYCDATHRIASEDDLISEKLLTLREGDEPLNGLQGAPN